MMSFYRRYFFLFSSSFDHFGRFQEAFKILRQSIKTEGVTGLVTVIWLSEFERQDYDTKPTGAKQKSCTVWKM